MFEKVLIIDDSVTARLVIRQYLEMAGCDGAEFREAAHGIIALEIIKQWRPDIIFSDINMPEMDGHFFLKRLKASPKYTDIPVVVISSVANDVNRDKLIGEGASFVVPKPPSLPVLSQCLKELGNTI